MKFHIFIEGEQRLHLPTLLQHKFAQQFDVGEFAVAGVDGGFAARQAFEGAEDVHVLLDIVYRWVGDAGAAALVIYQALIAEQADGFAQRRAADFERGGEFLLGQDGAGGQLLQQDHVAQFVGGFVGERGAAGELELFAQCLV